MNSKSNREQATIPVEPKTKKRPGRPPMSDAEREQAAKLRAAEKEKAGNLRPELFLQYQDCDIDMAELVEAAKADFHKTKKRTLVTELKLYIKPEDRMAYYVINEIYSGKIPF